MKSLKNPAAVFITRALLTIAVIFSAQLLLAGPVLAAEAVAEQTQAVAAPAPGAVIGAIGTEGFKSDADGTFIYGWTCQVGVATSLTFHVYAGPTGGNNHALLAGIADVANEVAVDNACKTTGVNHRYKLYIPNNLLAQYKGQKLYVYGIRQAGSVPNAALTNSGSFIFPAPPPATCTLTASPASITNGASTSLSWATTNATAISIDQGVDAVSPVAAGSKTVSPTQTTTYTATATGALSVAHCSAAVTVNTVRASQFSFLGPKDESVLSGSVQLNMEGVGSGGVTFSDNSSVLATVTSEPIGYTWDTTTVANGPHKITASGTDSAGNAASVSIWVTVWNPTKIVGDPSKVTVGAMATLGSALGMDSSIPSIVKGAQRFFFVTQAINWAKYSGTLDNPVQTKVWSKAPHLLLGRAAPPANKATVYDWTWLTNIYQVPGTGQVLGFVHVEQKAAADFGGGQAKSRVALAWSNDYGDTWKYLGNIIVPSKDPLQLVAGIPYVIKDGYFYIYYIESAHAADDTDRGTGIVSARAKVADVIAAAKLGKNVQWLKYRDGAWSSPGIGGTATRIAVGVNREVVFSTFTNKYYTALGKSGIFEGPSARPATLDLYESPDAMSWSFLKNIGTLAAVDTDGKGQGLVYDSMISTDGTGNNVVGKSFYVYAIVLAAERADRPIVRWRVDLGL